MKANRRAEKAEFWKRHLEAWAESGESQKAYCERHGLKWYSFNYWRTKAKSKGSSRLRLVPIAKGSSGGEKPGSKGLGQTMRIHVEGVCLELDSKTAPERLRSLVNALRQS